MFKKYSPLGELAATAAGYAEVLGKVAGLSAAVADRDRVVAAAGALRELGDRPLADAYAQLAQRRRLFAAAPEAGVPMCEDAQKSVNAVMPILCNGDLIGSVAFATKAVPEDSELALLRVAAAFLGRQLEE